MKTIKRLQKAALFALPLWVALAVSFASPILVTSSTPAQAEGDLPHWSYGGAANPTQWGRLGHDFALCEVGRDQSPINIDADNAIVGAKAEIDFNYGSVPLVVVNNGHTIQVNYAEGSTVRISGEEYELVQFHFHTPSEHTTSGQAYAMELHLVHRNAVGELAVLGIMMTEGIAHSAIATIWEHVPGEKTKAVAESTINAADLLPSSVNYFSYGGSLTTPPCSENVRWYVFAEPIQVSQEQIDRFENLYPVNARPTQPINGRQIEFHQE
ncbi:MAG: carbonic anhydrase [Cyanophyceae cyanobacterium]